MVGPFADMSPVFRHKALGCHDGGAVAQVFGLTFQYETGIGSTQ